MAGQRGKFVGCGDERQAREGRQFRGNGLAKAMGRVEAGADRRATLCQFANRWQCAADRALGVVELGDECR
ncbi:hypothetical protein D3C86_2085600 [compost metagenome]